MTITISTASPPTSDAATSELVLEINCSGAWQTVGAVVLLGDATAGEHAASEVRYDIDYVTAYLGCGHNRGLSVSLPVTFEPIRFRHWAPFLLDIFPQGAALRFIEQHFKIRDRREQYWQILTSVPLSPPGNLRTVPANSAAYSQSPIQAPHEGFSRAEVLDKGEDFLDHMIACGAPVSGTSGVGGAAPKFLLREDRDGRFHADSALADDRTKACWLVKFPRGRKELDADILAAESSYLAIAKELGLRVGGIPEYERGALFVPRFDRLIASNLPTYLGLESLYSASGIAIFGSHESHETYLKAIVHYSSTPADDFAEYLARDLLNEMMGNTDNHGRNSALLKSDSVTRLAPIFDFAPMKFDPEGVVPATRWADGKRDLLRTLREFSNTVPDLSDTVRDYLRGLAPKVKELEEMMRAHNLPPLFIEGTRDARRYAMQDISEFLAH